MICRSNNAGHVKSVEASLNKLICGAVLADSPRTEATVLVLAALPAAMFDMIPTKLPHGAVVLHPLESRLVATVSSPRADPLPEPTTAAALPTFTRWNNLVLLVTAPPAAQCLHEQDLPLAAHALHTMKLVRPMMTDW